MFKAIVLLTLTAGFLTGCSSPARDAGGQAEPETPVLETGSQHPMPEEWIDKDTRHKLIRLSRREGDNRSFYFHNNPFVQQTGDEGDKMVFYGRVDSFMNLFAINLKTLEIDQLTDRQERISGEIIAPKSREAFYQVKDSVFATGIDNGQTRLVYVFPEDFQSTITTLNADETLLAGSWASPEKQKIYAAYPDKSSYFERIYDARILHTLFTVNVQTGELKKLYSEKAWLNHVQFSPTDPNLLMYCHEGPWHKVNRIWTIDIRTGQTRLMHERTVDREIAGHEFFGRDGKKIWFDLQIPRGETFYLAGADLETGEETRYRLDRNEWSIHFNISPDQTLFAGDGGDSTQVAHAPDGRWIYLFKPENDQLASTKLVNMQYHGYRPLEPNVHFSPDGKWVIFRASFDGESQVYAVEIAPAG
ncbi:MAG TPA: oligogalacturonate lyase family protein [Flavilitoribacter sp.]|nr:oligogalacturonate lyase family protein [Flavilitoribacter sp.]HMQ91196.1 oligogalacturonate lyase family protein [Flavilitoribacter sp.]